MRGISVVPSEFAELGKVLSCSGEGSVSAEHYHASGRDEGSV